MFELDNFKEKNLSTQTFDIWFVQLTFKSREENEWFLSEIVKKLRKHRNICYKICWSIAFFTNSLISFTVLFRSNKIDQVKCLKWLSIFVHGAYHDKRDDGKMIVLLLPPPPPPLLHKLLNP